MTRSRDLVPGEIFKFYIAHFLCMNDRTIGLILVMLNKTVTKYNSVSNGRPTNLAIRK